MAGLRPQRSRVGNSCATPPPASDWPPFRDGSRRPRRRRRPCRRPPCPDAHPACCCRNATRHETSWTCPGCGSSSWTRRRRARRSAGSRLPAPRPIAVPCSWNELFDDARDYLGLAWYLHRDLAFRAAGAAGRVFVRVGSANYAAKVWVNGRLVAQHLGGHLPFAADVTEPAGVGPAERHRDRRREQAVARARAGRARRRRRRAVQRPDWAGIRPRPTTSSRSPACTGRCCSTRCRRRFIDDVTVDHDIDGRDGVVTRAGGCKRRLGGRGKAAAERRRRRRSTFRDGAAEATVRVPSARLWHPGDPHLYPLTVLLGDGKQATDAYTLDVGIRTVAVRGDQILLNGEPVKLRASASTKTSRSTAAA